ncbi:hypothetical protein GINT2_000487 [Glugoides intestinalis]
MTAITCIRSINKKVLNFALTAQIQMENNSYSENQHAGYKRKKSGLSKQQIAVLASIYNLNKKPTTFQRYEIAQRLDVCEDKIKNWFQNRRAKERKVDRALTGSKSGFKEDFPCDRKLYPACNDLYKRKP